MKSLFIISLCFCFLSYSQCGEIDPIESANSLAKLTTKLRTTSQNAAAGFQQQVDNFHVALNRHDVVKRDIESSFDDLSARINNAPEQCQNKIRNQLEGMKTLAVQNYLNCTTSTIFRAVGDSVKIVTVSFNMFYNIFQSLDDLVNGFANCYKSGVIHSIGCTISSVGTLINDVESTADLVFGYGENIKSLSTDVTNIINVCQHKTSPATVEAITILDLC